MRIRYLAFPPSLASARLRMYIPGRELRSRGHWVGFEGSADWVVMAKHAWTDEHLKDANKVAFDVCDDHFHDDKEAVYRRGCEIADVVTCNSNEMASVIKRETGRDAVVIPDPYESPECPAKCHLPLLWFGKDHNLHDLAPILDRLPEIVIVSDVEHPQIVRWSPEAMEAAWHGCGMTVIPTGYSMAKSANRAIESIRRGLYPVCGELPAYRELGLGEADIPAAVERAIASPQATKAQVRKLQDLIRDRFSPQAIGGQWEQVFRGEHAAHL